MEKRYMPIIIVLVLFVTLSQQEVFSSYSLRAVQNVDIVPNTNEYKSEFYQAQPLPIPAVQQSNAPPPGTDFRMPFYLAVVPNLNSHDVSIIDTLANQEVIRVPMPYQSEPFYVAMTTNGRFAYVATSQVVPPSIGRIHKIDLQSFQVIRTLSVAPTYEFGELEISPNGGYLIAGDLAKATIYIINTATDTLLSQLILCPLCGTPGPPERPLVSSPEVAFSDDSRFAYVANPVMELIHVIDLQTQQVINTLPIPTTRGTSDQVMDIRFAYPYLFAYRAYCNNGINSIRKYDLRYNTFQDIGQQNCNSATYYDFEILSDGRLVLGDIHYGWTPTFDRITIVDPASGLMTYIPSSDASRHLTPNRGGNKLWSTCPPIDPGLPTSCDPGKIDVFDLPTMRRITTITTPLHPYYYGYSSLSQDGKYFYTTTDATNNGVVVVDTQTYAVSRIQVGTRPRGVYMQGDNRVKEHMVAH